MPMTASDYLDVADHWLGMVDKELRLSGIPGRRESEDVSTDIAIAQVRAMQAVAAAIDHLAAAVESTQRSKASGKAGPSQQSTRTPRTKSEAPSGNGGPVRT